MKQERVIQVAAQLTRFSRRADRSVTLTFVTSTEMSNSEIALIDDFWQTEGHLLFKKNQFSESDVPKVDVPSNQKTPAQALRGSLYARYAALRERGDPRADMEWDAYYKVAMAHFKQEVDDSHPDNH